MNLRITKLCLGCFFVVAHARVCFAQNADELNLNCTKLLHEIESSWILADQQKVSKLLVNFDQNCNSADDSLLKKVNTYRGSPVSQNQPVVIQAKKRETPFSASLFKGTIEKTKNEEINPGLSAINGFEESSKNARIQSIQSEANLKEESSGEFLSSILTVVQGVTAAKAIRHAKSEVEVQQIFQALRKDSNATTFSSMPDGLLAEPGSLATYKLGESALSDSECNKRIILIQQQANNDLKINQNDPTLSASSLYTANQSQKDLFSGLCSNHPRASAYVMAAEKTMFDLRSKINELQIQKSTNTNSQIATKSITTDQQDQFIQKQINDRYNKQAQQIKSAQKQAEFDNFRKADLKRQLDESKKLVEQQEKQVQKARQSPQELDDSIFRGFDQVEGRTYINTVNISKGLLAEMSTSNSTTISGTNCADGIQVYNQSGHAVRVNVKFRWLQKYNCNQGACSYRNAYDTVTINLRSPDARRRMFSADILDDIRVLSSAGLTCNGTRIESTSFDYLD